MNRSRSGSARRAAGGRQLLLVAILPLLLLVVDGSRGAEAATCVASGTEAEINAALVGPGAVAVLCQGAVFALSGSVLLTAPGQAIYTEGKPTTAGRARLEITSPDVTVAVRFANLSGVSVSHIAIDGNRDAYGYEAPLASGGAGEALILGGATSTDQLVEHVLARDARSWSALQITNGPTATSCQRATVRNNEIVGPAANAMEWSDGISFACTDSEVVDNVVTDASDGNIVLFGAPGTVVARNTITAMNQEALGGINMVDFLPYAGDYRGTVVRDNVIRATGAPIHIGIAQGWGSWFCSADDSDYDSRVLHGGSVMGNDLGGDQLIYGMVVSGVTDWTVSGNAIAENRIAQPSTWGCDGEPVADPTEYLFESARAAGSFQQQFVDGHVHGALWSVTSWGSPVALNPPESSSTTAPSPTTPALAVVASSVPAKASTPPPFAVAAVPAPVRFTG